MYRQPSAPGVEDHAGGPSGSLLDMPGNLPELARQLSAIPGVVSLAEGELLARYTALRVGGPADLTAVAETADGLRRAVSTAWAVGVPCLLLGHGSNVLISDEGVRGLVVLNRARGIDFSGDRVVAESGAALPTLARQCVERGLAGLEWAIGIPGSVGGALVGNAGAWGGDMASTVVAARVLQTDGDAAWWPAEQFALRYRSSRLKYWPAEAGRRPVILEVEFQLDRADPASLKARVSDISARRRASQPTGATCGSVFRNPPGDYAGRLIEAAGLKGSRSGPAEISPLHANFVINHGSATAADVWSLIDLARRSVADQFGVDLSLEIELLGQWPGQRDQDKDGGPDEA